MYVQITCEIDQRRLIGARIVDLDMEHDCDI
jgi:hypothetical protein